MNPGNSFRRAWWLPGAHLQTLYPHVFRHRRLPALTRQRLELDDGDFLDIDWTDAKSGPIIVLLHGLEGSAKSHYAAGLLNSLNDSEFQVALLYFRGCSGEPNRLPRSYHSGETGDLDRVIRHLHASYPERAVYIVGFSLGGNVLLKWLGENPDQQLVRKAAAVSVPFQLDNAARRLEHGFSRFYQLYLLNKLRYSTRQKANRLKLPVNVARLRQLKSLRAFDDAITAPLHGFSGVDDYYRRASSYQFLSRITTPTLILHARDDPFMTHESIPDGISLGVGIQLEVSDHGGHVGFIAGRYPWKPHYWIDERICSWFAEYPISLK